MLKIWKKRKHRQGYKVGENFIATSSIEEAMEKLRKFTYQGAKITPFNKGMIEAIEDGLEKKMSEKAKKVQLDKELKVMEETQKRELQEKRLKEIDELNKLKGQKIDQNRER